MRDAIGLVAAIGRDRLNEQRVLAREAAAELCETLTGSGDRSTRRGEVFQLVQDVVRSNEAFPSAIGDRRRLEYIVRRLSEESRAGSLDTLNSVVEKMLFDAEPFAQSLVNVLREEVDWTLVRSVSERGVGTRAP